MVPPRPWMRSMRDQRKHHFGTGQRGGAEHQMNLSPQPAARDQHQPLGERRVLVRELHRDATAERVPDDRGAPMPERDEQVAHAGGVRPERVVAPRLGRLPVSEQVGRDHRVVLGEQRHHLVPLLGASHDSMDQQHHGTAIAGLPVADAVPVQLDLPRAGLKISQATLWAPVGGGRVGGRSGDAHRYPLDHPRSRAGRTLNAVRLRNATLDGAETATHAGLVSRSVPAAT